MLGDMSTFTPLEQTAVAAILVENAEHRAIIEQQLMQTVVLSRENTGGGFFTELEVGSDAQSFEADRPSLGQNVWLGVEGLEFGLGMILHFENGRASLLEGYAVAPEDTCAIDFADVRFAVVSESGPLSTNGS